MPMCNLGVSEFSGTLLAVSQFRVCILQRPHLKANYITTLPEGCSNLKAPPNAAFFSLFLEDAPLLTIVASHIPRFFACSKKNGDIAWRSSSLSQAWAAEIARPSHLTMVYVVNKGGYFLYHLWQIVGMVRWLVHMHNILRMIEMSEKKTLGNRRTWAFVNLRKRLCMHVSSVHRFIYLNILVCRAVDILFWIHKKYIKIVCIEWYHVLK